LKDLYIAKTFAGLEEILAQELRDLQIEEVEILNRAVSFRGDLRDLYTANYWCRTAIRILKPIADFPAEDELALYKGIRSIDWSQLIGLEDTFAIDCTLSNSKINHSQYAALKTKDAIADQFVFKFKERPNVDVVQPTLRASIFIQNNHCTVSLDTSNISLHKRGYRVSAGSAPLNEVLAAGMILLSGWDKKSHFVDPMCGSGTLLIEAALIAMNVPPASYRNYFGFLNFKDFNAELWKEIKIDALAKQRDFDFKIVGTDLAAGMIAVAEKNIKSAHLKNEIQLEQVPMQEFTPPEGPGIIVCNPPYGERIQTRDIVELYRAMGDTMKRKYGGYSAWVISSDIIALKQIGLYPSRKLELYNGPLECRFEKFEIYEGSKKEKYKSFESSDKRDVDRPKGPSYRRKDDWDREGKNTKFKGKTKSEWDLDSKEREQAKARRQESDERKPRRTDTDSGEEKSSSTTKSRPPRREFDRSKDRKSNRPYSDKKDGGSSYDSKSRGPRKEFDKSDYRKSSKPYSDRRDEGSSSSPKPKREVKKFTREIRERKSDSDKSGVNTTYYPKGRPPRKRIPKKPDND
jgi:putative N6-adenine-specific DNA methylase